MYKEKLNSEPKYQPIRDKYSNLSKVGESIYKKIHTKIATPLKIKIDCDLFKKEILKYEDKFEQFGNTHNYLPRYSLGLTDLKNNISSNPLPVNWPMDIWNYEHPDIPLWDTDFCIPNSYFKNLKSLKSLFYFDNHFARFCILKWNNSAHFKPHTDVKSPYTNFRIWGTTDPENSHFYFWNDELKDYKKLTSIEKGRLYLIDTSIMHHGYVTADNVYKFFLALQPNADKLIEEIILS